MGRIQNPRVPFGPIKSFCTLGNNMWKKCNFVIALEIFKNKGRWAVYLTERNDARVTYQTFFSEYFAECVLNIILKCKQNGAILLLKLFIWNQILPWQLDTLPVPRLGCVFPSTCLCNAFLLFYNTAFKIDTVHLSQNTLVSQANKIFNEYIAARVNF